MSALKVTLIGFVCVVGACGSPQEEPKATASPTATAVATSTASVPPPAASTASPASPRAKQTRLIVKAVNSAGIGEQQKSRMVAVGLSEEPAYKLSASWVKALEAAAGRMVDQANARPSWGLRSTSPT